MDPRYSDVLQWYFRNYNDNRIIDSISSKQIRCKQWLVHQLEPIVYPTMKEYQLWLIGGWFGYPLIDIIQQSSIKDLIAEYVNLDCDKHATSVCNNYARIFKHENVTTSTKNLSDMIEKMIGWGDKIFINTSTEHMPPIPHFVDTKHISPDSIWVLQSNDLFDEPDHINCVESVDELIELNKITRVHYKGEMKFDNYTRYMVIGQYG